MKREEFIRRSLAMGIGLPFLTSLIASCNKEEIDFPEFETNFSGKVIIVGAGAAGLAAGYLLQRYGVDFEIIEASSVYGGRVKREADFVDFPIDLGAEWIHASPSVLADILNNPQLDASIEFITYNPQTVATYQNGKLTQQNFISNYYNEYKFKSTTWHGFFEQFIVPELGDRISYNQPIVEIDTSSAKVRLKSLDDTTYEADKVIVTTPVKVLQQMPIAFIPELPKTKSDAINSIYVGDGLKVFLEFRQQFYPDILLFGSVWKGLSTDDKIFYDAAFRKDSNTHVLGLFTINDPASAYTSLGSDQAIVDKILNELDEIFDGQASTNYVRHVVQNWSNEPYIRGAYSFRFDNDQQDTVSTIKEPIDGKVYFAGEALSIDNQATVHGACESGYAAVEQVLT